MGCYNVFVPLLLFTIFCLQFRYITTLQIGVVRYTNAIYVSCATSEDVPSQVHCDGAGYFQQVVADRYVCQGPKTIGHVRVACPNEVCAIANDKFVNATGLVNTDVADISACVYGQNLLYYEVSTNIVTTGGKSKVYVLDYDNLIPVTVKLFAKLSANDAIFDSHWNLYVAPELLLDVNMTHLLLGKQQIPWNSAYYIPIQYLFDSMPVRKYWLSGHSVFLKSMPGRYACETWGGVLSCKNLETKNENFAHALAKRQTRTCGNYWSAFGVNGTCVGDGNIKECSWFCINSTEYLLSPASPLQMSGQCRNNVPRIGQVLRCGARFTTNNIAGPCNVAYRRVFGMNVLNVLGNCTLSGLDYACTYTCVDLTKQLNTPDGTETLAMNVIDCAVNSSFAYTNNRELRDQLNNCTAKPPTTSTAPSSAGPITTTTPYPATTTLGYEEDFDDVDVICPGLPVQSSVTVRPNHPRINELVVISVLSPLQVSVEIDDRMFVFSDCGHRVEERGISFMCTGCGDFYITLRLRRKYYRKTITIYAGASVLERYRLGDRRRSTTCIETGLASCFQARVRTLPQNATLYHISGNDVFGEYQGLRFAYTMQHTPQKRQAANVPDMCQIQRFSVWETIPVDQCLYFADLPTFQVSPTQYAASIICAAGAIGLAYPFILGSTSYGTCQQGLAYCHELNSLASTPNARDCLIKAHNLGYLTYDESTQVIVPTLLSFPTSCPNVFASRAQCNLQEPQYTEQCANNGVNLCQYIFNPFRYTDPVCAGLTLFYGYQTTSVPTLTLFDAKVLYALSGVPGNTGLNLTGAGVHWHSDLTDVRYTKVNVTGYGIHQVSCQQSPEYYQIASIQRHSCPSGFYTAADGSCFHEDMLYPSDGVNGLHVRTAYPELGLQCAGYEGFADTSVHRVPYLCPDNSLTVYYPNIRIYDDGMSWTLTSDYPVWVTLIVSGKLQMVEVLPDAKRVVSSVTGYKYPRARVQFDEKQNYWRYDFAKFFRLAPKLFPLHFVAAITGVVVLTSFIWVQLLVLLVSWLSGFVFLIIRVPWNTAVSCYYMCCRKKPEEGEDAPEEITSDTTAKLEEGQQRVEELFSVLRLRKSIVVNVNEKGVKTRRVEITQPKANELTFADKYSPFRPVFYFDILIRTGSVFYSAFGVVGWYLVVLPIEVKLLKVIAFSALHIFAISSRENIAQLPCALKPVSYGQACTHDTTLFVNDGVHLYRYPRLLKFSDLYQATDQLTLDICDDEKCVAKNISRGSSLVTKQTVRYPNIYDTTPTCSCVTTSSYIQWAVCKLFVPTCNFAVAYPVLTAFLFTLAVLLSMAYIMLKMVKHRWYLFRRFSRATVSLYKMALLGTTLLRKQSNRVASLVGGMESRCSTIHVRVKCAKYGATTVRCFSACLWTCLIVVIILLVAFVGNTPVNGLFNAAGVVGTTGPQLQTASEIICATNSTECFWSTNFRHEGELYVGLTREMKVVATKEVDGVTTVGDTVIKLSIVDVSLDISYKYEYTTGLVNFYTSVVCPGCTELNSLSFSCGQGGSASSCLGAAAPGCGGTQSFRCAPTFCPIVFVAGNTYSAGCNCAVYSAGAFRAHTVSNHYTISNIEPEVKLLVQRPDINGSYTDVDGHVHNNSAVVTIRSSYADDTLIVNGIYVPQIAFADVGEFDIYSHWPLSDCEVNSPHGVRECSRTMFNVGAPKYGGGSCGWFPYQSRTGVLDSLSLGAGCCTSSCTYAASPLFAYITGSSTCTQPGNIGNPSILDYASLADVLNCAKENLTLDIPDENGRELVYSHVLSGCRIPYGVIDGQVAGAMRPIDTGAITAISVSTECEGAYMAEMWIYCEMTLTGVGTTHYSVYSPTFGISADNREYTFTGPTMPTQYQIWSNYKTAKYQLCVKPTSADEVCVDVDHTFDDFFEGLGTNTTRVTTANFSPKNFSFADLFSALLGVLFGDLFATLFTIIFICGVYGGVGYIVFRYKVKSVKQDSEDKPAVANVKLAMWKALLITFVIGTIILFIAYMIGVGLYGLS